MVVGFLFISSSSSNYQNIKDDKEKEHKKLGSKPGKNPIRGKTQKSFSYRIR